MANPAPASKPQAALKQTPASAGPPLPAGSHPAPPKPDRSFLRLDLPIGAAESLRRRGIPLRSIRILPGGFEKLRQFERHHGVSRLLVKIRKLSRGILAGARAADAGGNLFPVGHFLDCIVTAEGLIGQQTPFALRGRDFFFSKGVSRLTARSLLSILPVALLEASNVAPVR